MSGHSADDLEPETIVGDGRDGAAMTTGAAIDRYLVIDRVGEGGMGVVVRAYDPKLQREVPVFDVGSHGEDLVVAMELIEGDNLRGWLRQRERSIAEIVDVFVQASEGLHAAHAEGLVHRDLKPGNLLVGNDGRVRVVDFGLARAVGAETSDSHVSGVGDVAGNQEHLTAPLTEIGAVVGTPAYMAPEQHRGVAADHRSDQYSLCLTLYEAIYGRRPFEAANNVALARMKADGPPPPGTRKGVPRALDRVIRRGLLPDPDGRFESLAELAAALRRMRSKQPLAIGISIAVVAVGLGLWVLGPDSNEGACLDASQAVASSWNDARRAELQHAYDHTEVAYARDAWIRTQAVADGWFKAWAEVKEQACLATRVRGEQSELRLAARVRCLEDARARAEALLEVMADARPDAVARGLPAFAELSPPALCLDVVAGDSQERQPELDRIAAMVRLGDGAVALPMARQLEERTDGATKAEAALLVGTILMDDERPEAARAYLEGAFFEAGRHERADLARDAAVVLARGMATAERWEEADEWAEHAKTMAERGELGARQRLQATALGAHVASRSGPSDALQTVLDEASEQLGPGDPTTLEIAGLLGDAALARGALDEAARVLTDARGQAVQALGAEHPHVAVVDLGLARADLAAGRIDAAKAKLESAADTLRSSLGPGNDHTVDAIALLARAHAQAGEVDDAKRLLSGAVEVSKRAKGSEHPRTRRLAQQLAAG